MILYSKQRGFTLVEMLVYVGILALILALVVGFMISLIRTHVRFRVEREISTNIKETMNYMIREIKSSSDVYVPTSVFAVHPGQLSLKTRANVPPDETSTFLDFYVDNGQLLLKRETQDPFVLTSDRVEIRNIIFRYFDNATLGESVQIELTLGYRTGSTRFEFQAEKSLISSASLRGQY